MCSKDIYTRHNWCVKSPPYAVVQMIGYKRSMKMEIKIATLNSHCPIIIIINPRQILRLADNTTSIPGFLAASFIFCVLFYYYLRGLNKSGAGSFFFKKFYRLINFSSHYVRGIDLLQRTLPYYPKEIRSVYCRPVKWIKMKNIKYLKSALKKKKILNRFQELNRKFKNKLITDLNNAIFS